MPSGEVDKKGRAIPSVSMSLGAISIKYGQREKWTFRCRKKKTDIDGGHNAGNDSITNLETGPGKQERAIIVLTNICSYCKGYLLEWFR